MDPSSKDYQVGVLAVHGIGEQVRGATLSTYADAIYGWIADRVIGVREGHLHRGISQQFLAQVANLSDTPNHAASVFWDLRFHHDPLPRDHVHSFVSYLEAEPNFRGTHEKDVIPPNEPVLASATISGVEFTNGPESRQIRLDWATTDGASKQSSWLMAESWWAEDFRPPKFGQLVKWIPYAFGITLGMTWWPRFVRASSRLGQRFAGPAGSIRKWLVHLMSFLWSIPWMILYLLGLPFVYVILAAISLASFLPWQTLRAAMQRIRVVLLGGIGDALVLANHPSARAAIVERIGRDLQWLASRCDAVIVVAHSQGAMLAYLACRERPANVKTLVTLGQGITKLRPLIDNTEPGFGNPSVTVRAAIQLTRVLAALMGLVVFASTAGALGLVDSGTSILITAVAFVLGLAAGSLAFSVLWSDGVTVRLDDLTWRSQMKAEGFAWLDYYATHDLVPAGAMDPDWGFQVVPADATTMDLPRGMPASVRVTNRRSWVRDHSSYLENRVEIVARLVRETARLDGTDSHKWLAPDSDELDSDICFARDAIVRRSKRISMAMVTAAVIVLLFRLDVIGDPQGLGSLIGDYLTGAGSMDLLLDQVQPRGADLGLLAVLGAWYIAVKSATAHSEGRLDRAVRERREWCTKKTNLDGAQLERRRISVYGAATGTEWAGLGLTVVVPSLVLVVMGRSVDGWEIGMWTLLSAIVAYTATGVLYMLANRWDTRRCFEPWAISRGVKPLPYPRSPAPTAEELKRRGCLPAA